MADESMWSSKSSTVPHLPQEIIESILDYNKDNIRTLRSCALVSRSFVSRSQEHIFSKITLGPALGPYISIKLRDIFAESPHLALLVNTLSIMEVSAGSQNWIMSSTALSAILPQMLRIGSLTLHSRSVTLLWGSLSEGFQHALITVITKGKVEHLVLTGVHNFPVRMIRAPTLMQLDLSDSYLEIASLYTPNPDTAAHDLERCHLKSLSINGQRYNMNPLIDIVSLMMDPRSGIDISSLRHLTIRPQYKQSELANFIPDFTAVKRLLQKTKLLKEVWIAPTFSILAGPREEQLVRELEFSLGHLPQLETLHLAFTTTNEYTPRGKLSYTWCSQLLKNSCPGDLPKLATINIVCDFPDANPIRSFNIAFWQSLDDILAAPALHSVQKVNLLYIYQWFQPEEHAPMKGLIEGEMRSLMKRGVLHVLGVQGSNDIPPSRASELVA